MPTEVKEETVLARSEIINARLGALRSALSDMFERLPTAAAAASEGKPQQPNVLDEVLSNQTESLKRIEDIYSLVQDQIKDRLM